MNKVQIVDLPRHVLLLESIGDVLDVGCHETSQWTANNKYFHKINNITFFDCDAWKCLWCDSNSVQGDANKLPFKDKSFDTVVMLETLEHIKNPITALLEAKRITRNKIIISVPSEYEWSKDLQNTFNGIFDEKAYRGKTLKEKVENATINLPTQFAKCIRYISEDKLPHISHKHFFKENDFISLIENINMKYVIFKMKYAGFVSFAAILER